MYDRTDRTDIKVVHLELLKKNWRKKMDKKRILSIN